MTEWVEQQICIQIEHSSVETIWMIEKAVSLRNRWLAASSHKAPAHASCLVKSFLVKRKITQVTQPPYSPDLVPCGFWLSPKLKSPLKGKRFRLSIIFRKIKWGSWWQLEELYEVPRPILKGTEVSLSYVKCFLFLVSFSIKYLCFSYYIAGNCLERPWIYFLLLCNKL